MSTRLAHLFARERDPFRTKRGIVTSVAPLRVLPEGATADIGPLPLVRSMPAMGDQVPIIWLPDQRTWAVLGSLATARSLVVVYRKQVLGDYPHPRIAFVAPDDSITYENVSTVRGDSNYHYVKNSSPHVFQMSDGAFVVLINRPRITGVGNVTGYHYAIRAPGGSWSGVTLFADDPNFAFNEADAHFTRDGDVIYAFTHGYQPPTTGLHRLAYNPITQTVSVTSVDLTNVLGNTNGVYGYGVYYDDVNALVHLWYGDGDTSGIASPPTVNYLDARDAVTLARAYITTGPRPAVYNYVGDGTDIDGDGATFFCGAHTCYGITAVCNIHRVVATSSAHTVTQETGVPTTSTATYVAFVWDGLNLNVVAQLGSIGGVKVLRRLGQNSYGEWTQIADLTGYRAVYTSMSVARLGEGDIAVVWDWTPTSITSIVSFRRRVGGMWGPFIQVSETNGNYFVSSNRSPLSV